MLPAERDEMVVAAAAVVVHVRRQQMPRECFDRLAEVAHQMGVAVVQADADVEPVEILFNHVEQVGRAREWIRDHLDGHAHIDLCRQRHQFLDASPRRVALVVGADGFARRHADVSHEKSERRMPGDAPGQPRPRQSPPAAGCRPTMRSRRRQPTSPWRSAANAGACTECSSRRVSDSHSASCARARSS